MPLRWRVATRYRPPLTHAIRKRTAPIASLMLPSGLTRVWNERAGALSRWDGSASARKIHVAKFSPAAWCWTDTKFIDSGSCRAASTAIRMSSRDSDTARAARCDPARCRPKMANPLKLDPLRQARTVVVEGLWRGCSRACRLFVRSVSEGSLSSASVPPTARSDPIYFSSQCRTSSPGLVLAKVLLGAKGHLRCRRPSSPPCRGWVPTIHDEPRSSLSRECFPPVRAWISDIEVVEVISARYDAWRQPRPNRWARAIGQLLPWLLGGPSRGRLTRNPCSRDRCWKMFRKPAFAPLSRHRVLGRTAGQALDAAPRSAALVWTVFSALLTVALHVFRCLVGRVIAALGPRHSGITGAQPFTCAICGPMFYDAL